MVDISIVIPAYNEEKYLKKTIESIRKQNIKKSFEIIVVDNESTDKTYEIAKKYADKVLKEREHIISKVRQKGALNANGEIIVSASADTIYDKNWLKNLIKPFEDKKVVATIGVVRPLDGEKIDYMFSDYILNPTAKILSKIHIFFSSADNIAIRKKIFKKINGFNTALITNEDADLIRRAAKHGKIKYVDNAIALVSMRRVKKWGRIKYLLFHTSNFINLHLLNKSHDHYEPIN